MVEADRPRASLPTRAASASSKRRRDALQVGTGISTSRLFRARTAARSRASTGCARPRQLAVAYPRLANGDRPDAGHDPRAEDGRGAPALPSRSRSAGQNQQPPRCRAALARQRRPVDESPRRDRRTRPQERRNTEGVSQRGTAGGSDHAADHRGDPARPCKTDLRSRHDPTRLSYATWRLDTPRDIRGNVRLPRPGYHRAAVAARPTDPARDYRRRRFEFLRASTASRCPLPIRWDVPPSVLSR